MTCAFFQASRSQRKKGNWQHNINSNQKGGQERVNTGPPIELPATNSRPSRYGQPPELSTHKIFESLDKKGARDMAVLDGELGLVRARARRFSNDLAALRASLAIGKYDMDVIFTYK